jgi:peptidoglycan/xylan/chitin deacetylase (PgdA/CDA1 family)
MYHNLCANETESIDLTVSASKFEEQLAYLKHKKFNSYFISEWDRMDLKHKRNVIITFDDVTENQLEFAVPLLKKYGFKATFFIPFGYVGKTDLWNAEHAVYQKIMTVEQLKLLDASVVELAHHSFFHKKYSTQTEYEIQKDFDYSFDFIKQNDLRVYPALAYPYGNYPKKGKEKEEFFKILERNNIKMAFRIGNRVNKVPIKNKFEVQRIDIKGQDNLFLFKLKLRLGKLKLF